jgi:thiamine monophosphate kinase
VAIARFVLSIAMLIALLIALAIVLRDVEANAHNTIVKGIHEAANFFAGAFTGLDTIKGHAKRELTIDWGIASVVYLIVGALIARSIARVGRSGLRYERSRRLAS